MQAGLTGVTLDGTGGYGGILPGLPYHCLAISCGKTDLANAIANFNATYAGKIQANGATIPAFVLPPDYQFGDPTFSQDFRVTKMFRFKERYSFMVFGEAFNTFNIANLTGYSFALDAKSAVPALQTYGFGQPTQRAGQTFASSGPRAIQVGARFSF